MAEPLTLVRYPGSPLDPAQMTTPVATTVFKPSSVWAFPDTTQRPVKAKPTPKKRKLNSGDPVSVEAGDGSSQAEPACLTIWRHRLQLVLPSHLADDVWQHLAETLPDIGAKIPVNVNLDAELRSGSVNFSVSHAEGDEVLLFRGHFPLSAEAKLLTDLLKKLRGGRLISEISIAWYLLPAAAAKSHPVLEFDVRRTDTCVINWKAEKWFSSFLALVTTKSDKPVVLSDLKGILATKASAKGDIKARDFYKSVYVPDSHRAVPEMIQVSELTTQMFPFQMRTVDWMMEREGVSAADGVIRDLPMNVSLENLCIAETIDYNGEKMFTSIPLGLTTSNLDQVRNLAAQFQIKGGILAEEMGLGKTVELISLLSLHKRQIPDDQHMVFDSYSQTSVRASGSTLIICPPSIMQQWVNELALHAPTLKVLKYNGTRDLLQLVYQKKNGIKARISNDRYVELAFELQGIPNAELVDNLLQYDIVLSSYNVLANELHYAERPPDRKLRHDKKYERRSCPLVEISWWRVCLDEAQMIENGISNAAQVARLIPRVNAWAVTGTPVQRSIEDLLGLLVFLRQNPWCGNKQIWEKLCFNKEWFSGVFKQLALRHTKDIVHEEIKLPKQHRTAISLGFSQVEEENYQRLFEQACNDIGVHLDGSPIAGDWNPENEEVRSRMRQWLVRLRQTCVHPQVGAWNRRALGASGPLRTVDEVLEVMIQQNTTSVKQDQRMMFMLVAANAQVLLEAEKHPKKAIETLEAPLNALETAVEECRKDVEVETKRRELEKEARKDKKKNKRTHPIDQHAERPDPIEDEYTEERPKEDWEESDDESDAEDPHGSVSELNKLKNRLRDIISVQHIFHFYLGDAYFNLKSEIPEDDEERKGERTELEVLENKHYEIAKRLRKELMTEPESNVNKMIMTIKSRTERQDFVEIPDMDVKEQKGGIESNSVMEDIQILAEKLSEQAEVLDEWRERLIQLLQVPLLDQEEGAEGDELQQSAEQQDEGFLYVALLRTVIADRSEALTGVTSGLAASEIKTAEERAEGQDEKHQTLFQELKARRDDVKPINVEDDIVAGTSAMPYSLRGLVAKLRKIANAFRDPNSGSRAKVEAGLVNESLKKLQPMIADQEKALKKLEKEISFLSDAFNARVEFYRQLQAVSDMVQQFEEEKALKANHVRTIDALRDKYAVEIRQLSERVARFKSKGRFLQHLQESQGESQRLCIICQDNVQSGVLTVCGHQFCKECMAAWYQHHQTCPTCKRHLRRVDLHPVTYKPEEVTIEKETRDSASGGSQDVSMLDGTNGIHIYTGIDQETFKDIKKIKLTASFGSKIDMVVRHLLWIRKHGGSKSVIFSQWKEVLDVFQKALEGNAIGFSSLEEKKGLNKFKDDPKCEAFLLHAKSQSAGLTLVAASNVFLCEPLVNTGLELQAIARVHRIGQKRETNVFLYVIGNTVEESVWRHTTRRRLEMMAKDEVASPSKKRKNREVDIKGKKRKIDDDEEDGEEELEMQLETANSLQLQEGTVMSMVERGQGGGEVVDNEQLWSCLFEVKRKDRSVELEETRREMVASAREEGRGNVVDDGLATLNLQGRVRIGESSNSGGG
ncbi:hypothetical protein ABW19_dt0201542 [Dactylella cylindrospora]|nr:hypothetical protein ABW19_dt0201542 [Dactylella cylindrospora]